MLIWNSSRWSWFIWKSEGTLKPVTLVCRTLSLWQRFLLCGNLPGVFHLAELVDLALTQFLYVKAVKEPSSFSGAMVGSPRNVLDF